MNFKAIAPIKQALIMAAGHAKRMRPLTDHLPKPLLQVRGKPLLTHIIDRLVAENVTRIVINGHHAIERLIAYIEEIQPFYSHCEIVLSQEEHLLETGGGAVKALRYLDADAPFYMINGDAFWINPPHPALSTLQSLQAQWRNGMECLLLLQSCETMILTSAVGDYYIVDGQAVRSLDRTGTHMFTGIRIVSPSVLKGKQPERFSFLDIMDECEDKKLLYAHHHQGQWYHLSTAENLKEVNQSGSGPIK